MLFRTDEQISGGVLEEVMHHDIISMFSLSDSAQIGLASVMLLSMVTIIYCHNNVRAKMRNLAPLSNPKKPFELTNERVRKVFIANAKGMIHSWFKTHPNKPVRINGDVGQYTIIPPHMIGEVDREELVSLTRWAYKVRCVYFVRKSHLSLTVADPNVESVLSCQHSWL